MSNIGIKDASDAIRKIDTYQRTEGADTVETQAVTVVTPADGIPVDFAKDTTVANVTSAVNATTTRLVNIQDNELTSIKANTYTTNTSVVAVKTAIESLQSDINAGLGGLLTDTQLRATPVPVDGPLTDTQLRATAVPVNGPLTDAQLRATPFQTAMSAIGAEYWPGYSGAPDPSILPLHVDPSGALVTRGAVTTDEGTFRVNFANTSLAVSIGAVTVSGTTVTGTGFLEADVHYLDYFKISTEDDTAWVQIDSVVSDTEIQLTTAYVGSASGTGQRSLLFPLIGSGGSLTVGSGQLTIASGTTTSAITGVKRFTDYSPLVFRARVSISQRIVNQDTHIGLEEDAAITRWFARFVASGTTNTTILCETGRNPTGAPSASETETSTVTLPNGQTTAALNDYRVEQLTESVRFYINSIMVAEHVRVLPHQHDPMTSHVEVRNGTAPASTTSVVVDYLTGKNHNKLEVGIMSDVEKIVAAAVPLQQFTYSVAGVIAINTDLIVLDCSQLRSLFIQCNSMGTTGVATVAWSNTPDFAQPITATLMSEAGATSTTFNAAVLRVTNVLARYCRIRLTTATTAGTTTLNVWGAQTTYTPIVTTQPVSGTVTANIGTGALAAGTNAIGDVGLQYRANATGAATTLKFASAATVNNALVLTGARRLIGWSLTNTTASFKYFRFYNKATAPVSGESPTFMVGIPPNSTVVSPPVVGGIAMSLGLGIACTGAVADTDATVTAANDVVGFINYA